MFAPYFYPGIGSLREVGQGSGRGFTLNVPLPPNADDALFLRLWPTARQFIDAACPEFLLLQCGADCLADDPLTHLRLSTVIHEQVTRDLCAIADNHCRGRLLATGCRGGDVKVWDVSSFTEITTLHAPSR